MRLSDRKVPFSARVDYSVGHKRVRLLYPLAGGRARACCEGGGAAGGDGGGRAGFASRAQVPAGFLSALGGSVGLHGCHLQPGLAPGAGCRMWSGCSADS